MSKHTGWFSNLGYESEYVETAEELSKVGFPTDLEARCFMMGFVRSCLELPKGSPGQAVEGLDEGESESIYLSVINEEDPASVAQLEERQLDTLEVARSIRVARTIEAEC